MPSAMYLFCLTAHCPTIEIHPAAPQGYGGLVQMEEGSVTAIACEVPLGDFSGESAEEHLESLSWVGPRALFHGEVVREVMDRAPVLPARFGTLFSSREGLAGFIAANHETIVDFLDGVVDQEEWSLKVLVSKSKAIEHFMAAEMRFHAAELASASPGIRYFKEKLIRNHAEKQIAARASEIGVNLASRLRDLASQWRKRTIVPSSDRDGDASLVAHWAFLVPRAKTSEFFSAVDDCNCRHEAAGLLFQASGPWPPYSFTPELSTEL